MVEWAGQKSFAHKFIARVKAAREEAAYTENEMAVLLKVPLYAYKQYESDVLLPHHLVLRFCLFTGLELFELFGGFDEIGKQSNGGRRK